MSELKILILGRGPLKGFVLFLLFYASAAKVM